MAGRKPAFLPAAMADEDGEERTMELTIEALTGTVYDLCVSPYETILGIKMKVQRLEGIPVYQQQLVWGGIELQDELCLEEYSIPTGAQLKLLVAMRGGPIHAQRVHLDLEDSAIFEIAELLDSQAGDKYTLMLLRNGDDLDNASIVQVQMLDEEDTMRLSPIQVTEPGQHLSIASKSTRMEHAVTRDKMKELMAKFKKGKEFRQAPPTLTSQAPSGRLPRKSTGKLLILESRAPSRVLHNPSSRMTPLSSARANETKLAQRKLVFPSEHIHPSGKTRSRITSCSVTSRATRRVRSPSEEAPIISRQTCPRVSEELANDVFSGTPSLLDGPGDSKLFEEAAGIDCPTPPKRLGRAELPHKNWQKPPKRKRRTNHVEPDMTSYTAINNLSRNLSHLELNPSLPSDPTERVPKLDTRTKCDFLPPILTPHPPISTHPTHKGGMNHTLPSLSIATASKPQSLSVARKKRCMKCGKKMGLASTYSCRCGGLFCAMHRYAETHSCTFDYKTEGRQIIARSNPVVAAQKLPKI